MFVLSAYNHFLRNTESEIVVKNNKIIAWRRMARIHDWIRGKQWCKYLSVYDLTLDLLLIHFYVKRVAFFCTVKA